MNYKNTHARTRVCISGESRKSTGGATIICGQGSPTSSNGTLEMFGRGSPLTLQWQQFKKKQKKTPKKKKKKAWTHSVPRILQVVIYRVQ